MMSVDAPIRTRVLWTWDHCTEWALNRPGAQTMGASNHYCRRPEAFVQDYTNLMTWCGQHGIDAVVIWGLLRDCHGGVESVKRLCEVAAANNVRLLCGVGLNAYGGVYYEGDSPYGLENHLQQHPELYAVDADGQRMVMGFGSSGPRPTHHACPSRRENQEFIAESLQWLFRTVPLSGVQMESGDTGVCRCQACRERRRHPISSFSWEDMALVYPLAADAIRSVSKDAWIICETYSHPEPVAAADPAPGFGDGMPPWAGAALAEFPKGAFVQWVCDRWVKPSVERRWTAAGTVSGAERLHLMRAHFSTYWMGIRGEPAVDWIAEMVQASIAHGFDGTSLFGEVSPFHTGAELNYLALANYGSAANPTADHERFMAEVAAPLLGGAENAREFLRFARLVRDLPKVPEALRTVRAKAASLPEEPARRWTWLANYLASFAYP